MACEQRPVPLVIKENIEMKVFSSKELCKVVITQEEEHSFQRRCMKCPLVSNHEQDLELQVQTQPRPQAKLKTTSPGREEPQCPVVVCKQNIEIELEAISPIKESKCQLTKSSLNKANSLKWKRLIPQNKRLVVKDVVCLPGGHCMSQLDRQIVQTETQSKEHAALAAMGMTARITIDSSWSATQVQSRLAMLFHGHFVNQTFSFTYLQCVQGSGVLFVPDTPAEGWTAEQVLRISGHGALYVQSHQDYSQVV